MSTLTFIQGSKYLNPACCGRVIKMGMQTSRCRVCGATFDTVDTARQTLMANGYVPRDADMIKASVVHALLVTGSMP